MKTRRLVALLQFLFLMTKAFQLLAQQSEAERQAFEEAKAKAEKGDVSAEYRVGLCYATGRGVSEDKGEAMKWLRKAAELGQPNGQYLLGLFYSKDKNYPEALKWYRKAAEQGEVDGQMELARGYFSGRWTTNDYGEALKWLRKAANQGHAEAQFSLGVFYENGYGVGKDLAEAVKWYREAAEQGFAHAESNLGVLFGTGEGVIKNYIEAYKWCILASAHGDELSREKLNYLEGRMTPEQIAEGQRVAREFKPHKALEAESANSVKEFTEPRPATTGTGFAITEDGYLITNEHVVKDAAQVRLVTSAGLISARVVKVDAANDLALLKAEGKFSSLPIAPSRAVKLGGTVATVGFPNIGLQGFAAKFARGEIASLSSAGDDARYFQISVPVLLLC